MSAGSVAQRGKGAVTKGAAGSISLAANTTVEKQSIMVDEEALAGSIHAMGNFALNGNCLASTSVRAGLSISGVPSLTLGGQTGSSDKGLQLGQDFFSDHGFGNVQAVGAQVM